MSDDPLRSEPEEEVNRAPQNQPKTVSGAFSDQIAPMRLADICGEHSLIRKLDGVLKRPPFPTPKSEFMPPRVLRHLLERMPILIAQENGKTVCIGNVRLFRLAGTVLPEESVPTVQYLGSLSRKRREQLEQAFLVETFLMPAIFGRREEELRALKAMWKRASDENLLDFWTGVDDLDALFRRDRVPAERK